MFWLDVFIFCIVIGEGGFGGVLGIGVGDWVLMLENVVYIVVILEVCVVIFWKDVKKFDKVAIVLKIIVDDLVKL